MDKPSQRRLEDAGWRLGTAADFLGLTEAEAGLVELKLRLSEALRARRLGRGISQASFAKQLRSSQSRVAKWKRLARPCLLISWCAGSWPWAQSPAITIVVDFEDGPLSFGMLAGTGKAVSDILVGYDAETNTCHPPRRPCPG